MRILIIDNNIDPDCWGATDLRNLSRLMPEGSFHVRRAPHGDLPSSPFGFDRIIVSGSKTSALADAPWIENLHGFIRSAVDRGIPFLGVCYGHQSLIRALGGKEFLRNAANPEVGWTKIDLLSRSPLFAGLPDSFYSFSSHFQEAGSIPDGFRLVARSEWCGIQAVELPGKPVFGIQFHPEKDLAGGERTLLNSKKRGEPKELLGFGRGKQLFDEKVGELIFSNFLKGAVSPQ